MANDNNIKNFTLTDIEKYHKGILSPAEMHAIEKAALDDSFLADAIEGYAVPGINISGDISGLKKRLDEKIGETKIVVMPMRSQSSFHWLRIAIILVLIAGSGLIAYQFFLKGNNKQSPIVQVPDKSRVQPAAPSSDKQLTQDSFQYYKSSDQSQAGNIQSQSGLKKDQAQSLAATKNDNIAKDFLNKHPAQGENDLSVANQTRQQNVTSATNVPFTELKNYDTISHVRPVEKNKATAFDSNLPAKEVPTAISQDDKRLNEVVVVGYGNAKRSRANVYDNINTFHGRVTDGNNNALPFANVTNSRDNVGTYSDAQGNFTLVSTDSVLNVQVRSLGFMNKNVQLKNATAVNKVMLQDDRNLPVDTLDKVKRNIRRNRNSTMTLEDPEPEDGWDFYSSYVMNNLNIPESYDFKQEATHTDNTVEVSFEVNKFGDPVNLKIEKSLCNKCDEEAKRLIKAGPKWKRKTKKSKRATLSIPFIKQD